MKLRDKRSHGYPALAQLMGPHPGMAMFKRFSSLAAHDLLLRQAELLQLERKLHVQGMIDQHAGLLYSEKADDLFGSEIAGVDKHQLDIVLEIREKLKQYNEALLLQHQLSQLPAPERHDIRTLQEWLKRKNGGNLFLKGVEDEPYLNGEESDLLAVSPRDLDALTNFVSARIVPWLFRSGVQKRALIPGQEELGLVEWSEETYRHSSRAIAVIFSTLIPSLAIIILYFVHNLIARILVAMGMSFVFSMTLALLTSVRAAEIFASTAAFAAVQVVFIGSTQLGRETST